MNATVARIVEIMFQDTEITEEVLALKDEIMNNCQERYMDMITRGMDEDEAISVVVDSLKGMEEVIAEYPKKQSVVEDDIQDDEEEDICFAADEVEQLQANLLSEDITLSVSEDDMIHVCYNKHEIPFLCVICEGGVLSIERTEGEKKRFTHVDVKGKNFTFDGNKALMENLSDMFRALSESFVNISINVNCGQIRVAVPAGKLLDYDIHTTSGDVEAQQISARALQMVSNSGDVTLQAQEGHVKLLTIKTSSGDVHAHTAAEVASVSTMSGDAEMLGAYADAVLSTVSGDITLSGSMKNATVKTVSGDIDVAVKSDVLKSLLGNTTSGDVIIRLPESLQGQVGVKMISVSGDVRNRFGEAYNGARAQVEISTVSGDVVVK